MYYISDLFYHVPLYVNWPSYFLARSIVMARLSHKCVSVLY